MRLSNITGAADDALHAGALELARLGAVGDLLRHAVGAQPLVRQVDERRVIGGTQTRYGGE